MQVRVREEHRDGREYEYEELSKGGDKRSGER